MYRYEEAGCTPLHVAAGTGGSKNLLKSLLSLGADKTARSLAGDTPFSTAIKRRQSTADFVKCFNLKAAAVDVERKKASLRQEVDAMLELAPDNVRASLVDGVMSPRMHRRLLIHAEVLSDQCEDSLPEFKNGFPLPTNEVDTTIGWDHIPLDVQGDHVYKVWDHRSVDPQHHG